MQQALQNSLNDPNSGLQALQNANKRLSATLQGLTTVFSVDSQGNVSFRTGISAQDVQAANDVSAGHAVVVNGVPLTVP